MTEQTLELSDHDMKLVDPVCGMSVTEQSEHHHSHNGTSYYFCSSGCEQKFADSPDQYLKPAKAESPICTDGSCDVSTDIYTCPMHPEIEQPGPGSCPKCGMALEAKTVTIDEKNHELIDMTRRFWISTALALPVFLLAMTADLAPSLLPDALSMHVVQWLEFVFATPVVIWGGWPFFVRGVNSVISWNLNMFTLIGLGVSVAWSYSIVALLFPGLFPPEMQMEGGLVAVYFEAAAVITALVLMGQVLELRARSQTNSAIKMLLGLAPKTA
ncbi:MAG: YHS domain-containing protein, partial [Gammaproteobacteria bacterium]|nr:YHS domain-containing protein [Gammaproteobacteria bacterium]